MHAVKRKGRLTLTVQAGERRLLRRVLEAIIRNYKTPPEALPSPVSQVWYSTAGCRSARMSDEQTGEWIESLRAIRQSRLRLLQRFARQLKSTGKGNSELRMNTDSAAAFMTALNDHRLFLAARHNLGEAEINWFYLDSAESLTPARRKALFEIGALAFAIGVLLGALDPVAASWDE
jgi:hypothetical protein